MVPNSIGVLVAKAQPLPLVSDVHYLFHLHPHAQGSLSVAFALIPYGPFTIPALEIHPMLTKEALERRAAPCSVVRLASARAMHHIHAASPQLDEGLLEVERMHEGAEAGEARSGRVAVHGVGVGLDVKQGEKRHLDALDDGPETGRDVVSGHVLRLSMHSALLRERGLPWETHVFDDIEGFEKGYHRGLPERQEHWNTR